MLYNAGAGHADIYHRAALTHAVEGARHEGIVLHRVAKNDKFSAAETVPVGSRFGRLLDNFSHQPYGIHIDARLGRADIYRRTQSFGRSQYFRYALNESPLIIGHALVNERRIAAQKIYAELPGSIVERLTDKIRLPRKGRAYQTYGRHRYPFIYYGYAVLCRQVGGNFYYILSFFADGIVHTLRSFLSSRTDTGQQRYTHSDRADIEVLPLYHLYSFKHIFIVEHAPPLTRCAWR